MDMMRTLLIYLSTTMAFAVQSTSAPQETPTPSPEPVAVVETIAPDASGKGTADVTFTPQPDETPMAAAAATERPTPAPVPTITPNYKGYHNLAMGAKGKEVVRLQEKLIEMKYLPEGAADGAYGRQTYNAVRKFQYYNGLAQDGVAGRATQTNLFENPDIVRNPEAKEETPAPEAEPQEAEASAAGQDAGAESAQGEAELTAVPPELLDQFMNSEASPEPSVEPAEETATEAPTEEPAEETATEAPTEEPAEETVTEAPTEEPAEETVTEAPAEEPAEETVTEAPAEEPTEEPSATSEPEEAPDEIVENVDLDADVYEEIIGSVALNEGDGPLEFIATVDGVPVRAKPRLTQNGAKIRVSLDDLCRCVEGWQLTDDGVGSIVLEAAGYTLAIYNEESGCSATVDGTDVPMKEDDLDFSADGHFINAEFLAEALKGEAAWDPEESTLMLRIREKETEEVSD